MRTIVDSDTQILLNNFTATRAGLGGVLGIDLDYRSAGPFCLVGQEAKELCPRCVVDILVQNSEIIFNHFFRLKFFDVDVSEFIDYLSGEFMLKVSSLVTDSFVKASKFLSHVLAALPGISALRFFEFRFGLLKIFGIVDFPAIGHDGKSLDSDVDSDFLFGSGKDVLRNIVAGKRGDEPAVLSLYRDCFDRSFDVPVKPYPDGADILNVELPFFQFNSISVGREGDRVKIIPAFESWKTGPVSFFHAAKECLERLVQTPENILRSGIVKLSNSFVKATDFLKRIGLVVITDRLAPLFPADDPLLKGVIVQKTSRIEKTVKLSFLSLVGKQPVFKGLPHFAFSKYSSIARRICSAVFKPVFLANSSKSLICLSVRCVFIRFIQTLYTLHIVCQLKKERRIPLPPKGGSILAHNIMRGTGGY